MFFFLFEKNKGKGVMVTYWLEGGRRGFSTQQTSSFGNQSSFNELEKDISLQDEFRQSLNKHNTEYSSLNNNNTATKESIANIE